MLGYHPVAFRTKINKILEKRKPPRMRLLTSAPFTVDLKFKVYGLRLFQVERLAFSCTTF